MLVIDASVAVAACAKEDGFTELGDELGAPPLMWSEARANLHLELFKGEIDREDAEIMHAWSADPCSSTTARPTAAGVGTVRGA